MTDLLLFAVFVLLVAWLIVRGLQIDGEEMLREWREHFPDRCPICAFHRYGVQNGHLRPGTPVNDHYCIEEEPHASP